EFEEPDTNWEDEGDYYRMDTEEVTLRVYKEPLRFELYESDNKTVVWKEKEGLSWNDDGTKQTLERVFEDTDKRDGSYLPEGKWIDYRSGEVYNGPQMVNDYDAPLET